MATSGTVALTRIDVTSTLEHAVRRCGVLTTAITAEMQQSARENLFLILTNFSARGLALWCVKKYVYALPAGQPVLTLDLGIEEVMHAMCRTFTPGAGTVMPGSALFTPTNPVTVDGVILDVPASATALTFVVEGSVDNLLWKEYARATYVPAAQATYSLDCDGSVNAAYWRVREVTVGTVVMNSANFIYGAREVRMDIMGQDMYVNLPDKHAAGRPLQYWYDKAFPQQRLWMWQVPLADLMFQAVIWAKRHIQDVGDLSNTLEIPLRWHDAVIFELSTRVCLELPKELVPAGRYELLSTRAEDSLNTVLNAETDGASIHLAPRIGMYTK